MKPDQWASLTPAGLRVAGRNHPATEQEGSPVAVAVAPGNPAVNVAAIVSLAAAHLGLLVMSLVLGPVAVVAGVVGGVLAVRTGRGGGMSAAGILIGLFGTFIGLGGSGLV